MQGLNFTDEVYDGFYRGKVKHPSDRKEVLERAWNVGVSKIMITGLVVSGIRDMKLAIWRKPSRRLLWRERIRVSTRRLAFIQHVAVSSRSRRRIPSSPS